MLSRGMMFIVRFRAIESYQDFRNISFMQCKEGIFTFRKS